MSSLGEKEKVLVIQVTCCISYSPEEIRIFDFFWQTTSGLGQEDKAARKGKDKIEYCINKQTDKPKYYVGTMGQAMKICFHRVLGLTGFSNKWAFAVH